MRSIQDVYIGQPLAWPQLVAPTASLTSLYIDTANCPKNSATSLRVVLYLGATDCALTVLKLQGSDDHSTWVDLVGTRYGTDNDVDGTALVLPTGTDDNLAFGWIVNANSGAYRYYQAVLTVGAGSAGANVCIAVEADQSVNILSPIAPATGFKQLAAYPVVQQTTH